MISPSLFNGLLELKGPQIESLEELALAVPELFVIPDFDIKRICDSLRRIQRQPAAPDEPTTVKTRTVPKATPSAGAAAAREDINKLALEVAKTEVDPTKGPLPVGWAVGTCSSYQNGQPCKRQFLVPPAKRLPTTCWGCLSQAGRNLRTKNIRAFLLGK